MPRHKHNALRGWPAIPPHPCYTHTTRARPRPLIQQNSGNDFLALKYLRRGHPMRDVQTATYGIGYVRARVEVTIVRTRPYIPQVRDQARHRVQPPAPPCRIAHAGLSLLTRYCAGGSSVRAVVEVQQTPVRRGSALAGGRTLRASTPSGTQRHIMSSVRTSAPSNSTSGSSCSIGARPRFPFWSSKCYT